MRPIVVNVTTVINAIYGRGSEQSRADRFYYFPYRLCRAFCTAVLHLHGHLNYHM